MVPGNQRTAVLERTFHLEPLEVVRRIRDRQIHSVEEAAMSDKVHMVEEGILIALHPPILSVKRKNSIVQLVPIVHSMKFPTGRIVDSRMNLQSSFLLFHSTSTFLICTSNDMIVN